MPLFAKNDDPVHDLIADLANTFHSLGKKIHVNLDNEGFYISNPDEVASNPGALDLIERADNLLETAIRPVSLSFDPAGTSLIDISLGGVPVPLTKPGSLSTAVADIAFIQDITRNMPGGEEETYVVGRPGRLNHDQRFATIRTDKPVEMALKMMAVLYPGMSARPESVVDRDIHGADGVEVRTSHDWAKVDIDDLIERARDEIRISIEKDTPDFSM